MTTAPCCARRCRYADKPDPARFVDRSTAVEDKAWNRPSHAASAVREATHMLTIRRFFSNAWLAATPLVILFAIVAAFATIGLASEIIARVAGTQTSENFIANV